MRGSEIRKLIVRDVDPSAQRKERRAALADANANTFKAIALAWHTRFKSKEQLPSKKVKHRAAIKDPVLFGLLLRAIDVY